MKTTLQIPDSLFEEVRSLAQREQTTLEALVEQGLQKVISECERRSRFRLRKATSMGPHGKKSATSAMRGEAADDRC
jgi:hypothetical protein